MEVELVIDKFEMVLEEKAMSPFEKVSVVVVALLVKG